MYSYAELDASNIVQHVLSFSRPCPTDNRVLVPSPAKSADYLGKEYNSDDGTFSAVESTDTATLSPYEFACLFTQAERVAIRSARTTDTSLDDFMFLLENYAKEIDFGDTNVINGFAYMVSIAVITQARADEILAYTP